MAKLHRLSRLTFFGFVGGVSPGDAAIGIEIDYVRFWERIFDGWLRRLLGKCEFESASFAFFAFDRDRAALHFHQRFADCESQAGSFVDFRIV